MMQKTALLCEVTSEEFVEDFTSDVELTPIDIVSEITGLTYDEIKAKAIHPKG